MTDAGAVVVTLIFGYAVRRLVLGLAQGFPRLRHTPNFIPAV